MASELAYEVHGDGAPQVLLIHGWLTSRAVWAEVADLLAAAQPVLVPDLVGFGDSGGEAPSELQPQVDELLALLDDLGIDRIHVAGHSMGGGIAQLLAVTAPERVASLTLVAPVPASGFPLPPEIYAQFESIGGNAEALQGFLTPQFADPERVPLFVDEAMKASVESAKNSLAAWTSCSFAAGLGAIQVPTVVVCGAKDPFLTAEVLQPAVVDAISGARLETLDSGGHYVLVDDAPAVAGIIQSQVS